MFEEHEDSIFHNLDASLLHRSISAPPIAENVSSAHLPPWNVNDEPVYYRYVPSSLNPRLPKQLQKGHDTMDDILIGLPRDSSAVDIADDQSIKREYGHLLDAGGSKTPLDQIQEDFPTTPSHIYGALPLPPSSSLKPQQTHTHTHAYPPTRPHSHKNVSKTAGSDMNGVHEFLAMDPVTAQALAGIANMEESFQRVSLGNEPSFAQRRPVPQPYSHGRVALPNADTTSSHLPQHNVPGRGTQLQEPRYVLGNQPSYSFEGSSYSNPTRNSSGEYDPYYRVGPGYSQEGVYGSVHPSLGAEQSSGRAEMGLMPSHNLQQPYWPPGSAQDVGRGSGLAVGGSHHSHTHLQQVAPRPVHAHQMYGGGSHTLTRMSGNVTPPPHIHTQAHAHTHMPTRGNYSSTSPPQQIQRPNSTSPSHGEGGHKRGGDRNQRDRNRNSPASGGAASRDPLVEDFRNTYGKTKQWEIRDIRGHVIPFCQDQHGSRFIQQKLEDASDTDKQLIFDELLPTAHSLMKDVFGNYVVQKLFEYGTQDQRSTLASLLIGQAVSMALQMYGCRVIQKALEYVDTQRLLVLVAEFEGQVTRCVHDQNGNHVIQKCIEVVSKAAREAAPENSAYLSSRIQFIIDSFQGRVKELATHPYGCRVIQRILEHCTNSQKAFVLEELRQCSHELIRDQYGNYVIQHVMQHGWDTDKALLLREVKGNILEYSQHKFASNVVEKCMQFAPKRDRDEMISEILKPDGRGSSILESMLRDPYANYVVQRIIEVADDRHRELILKFVQDNISQLRRYTYGKHIIGKLEKITGQRL